MADETRHARDCFALAQRYLGYAVGPGALPMHQALQETTLEEIVRLTVREGCIGATCAALEAAEAYEATVDPYVRAVLEKIRADELRHAELAWRFVSWALTEPASNGDARARLRRVVSAEFTSAAEEVTVEGALVEGSRAAATAASTRCPTALCLARYCPKSDVAPCSTSYCHAQRACCARSVKLPIRRWRRPLV